MARTRVGLVLEGLRAVAEGKFAHVLLNFINDALGDEFIEDASSATLHELLTDFRVYEPGASAIFAVFSLLDEDLQGETAIIQYCHEGATADAFSRIMSLAAEGRLDAQEAAWVKTQRVSFFAGTKKKVIPDLFDAAAAVDPRDLAAFAAKARALPTKRRPPKAKRPARKGRKD